MRFHLNIVADFRQKIGCVISDLDVSKHLLDRGIIEFLTSYRKGLLTNILRQKIKKVCEPTTTASNT